jgi:hypothetical protein
MKPAGYVSPYCALPVILGVIIVWCSYPEVRASPWFNLLAGLMIGVWGTWYMYDFVCESYRNTIRDILDKNTEHDEDLKSVADVMKKFVKEPE